MLFYFQCWLNFKLKLLTFYSEEPAVVVDPRKMHKEFYKKLFAYFQQENFKEKTQEENNENTDVEIKGKYHLLNLK